MNTHWVLTLTAALAGALTLSGCDKKPSATESNQKTETAAPAGDSAKPTTEAPALPEASANAPAQANEAKPEIKLIDAGSEPRRALRYKLAKGAQEKLVMTMEMTMKSKMPGMNVPEVKLPTLSMHMDMSITEALPNDEVRYEFVMSDAKIASGPDVNAQMAEMTQAALDQAKGMRGQVIVDSRGFNRDARVEFPPTMMPQMQEMLGGTVDSVKQMSSPLPEEPVGKGAKWELRQTIEQNGMKIDQVTLFELVELTGDTGTLKAQITQNAGEQTLSVPGGMGSAVLKWLKSQGSGNVQFTLTNLVPKSDMQVSSDYAMQVDTGGQAQVMEAHMDMHVKIQQR